MSPKLLLTSGIGRVRLSDSPEQLLVEGKKIDLASLGPGCKEAIDEIQIGLSKKAKGL